MRGGVRGGWCWDGGGGSGVGSGGILGSALEKGPALRRFCVKTASSDNQYSNNYDRDLNHTTSTTIELLLQRRSFFLFCFLQQEKDPPSGNLMGGGQGGGATNNSNRGKEGSEEGCSGVGRGSQRVFFSCVPRFVMDARLRCDEKPGTMVSLGDWR